MSLGSLADGGRARSNVPTGSGSGVRVPVVEPDEPGPSAWFARGGRHPIAAFAWAAVAGYALLAAGITALGLLLTRVLLDLGDVASADEYLPDRLAANRTPDLTSASHVGSLVGDIPVLPGLVILVVVAALLLRRFRVGAFVATAALMEVTLYRVGTLAAPRERPDVPRLDTHLPMDESFPSGHVAASTAVYGGIALLIASRYSDRPWVVRTVWAVAVAAVAVVLVSRLYRGMHHPLDTLAGLLLGVGCIVAALVAVRAYGHAERHRHTRTRTRTEEPV
ncbi:MAG: phosphatase PAP2 family protein [Thermoleophilia bacterium]